ncbi:MAG: DUF3316 domain-containing protein [Tannerella sp.]|jgi:hypothetical protein|nr:DUF3316 domain-containing protein [Tannerella sp.]
MKILRGVLTMTVAIALFGTILSPCTVVAQNITKEETDCFVPCNDVPFQRRHCEQSEAISSLSTDCFVPRNDMSDADCFVPRNYETREEAKPNRFSKPVRFDEKTTPNDTIKKTTPRDTTAKLVNRNRGALTEDVNNTVQDVEDLRSINEGSMIGVGLFGMKDTYLSPMAYDGYGFRFMNERMKLASKTNYRLSRQTMVNVNIASTVNGAENANYLSAFVDYALSYHYRFLPDPFFKIMVGGGPRGMFGMVYNTRNGNNPMTLHADIDLNFSLIAIYEFKIKKYPLALRYQLESPIMGVLFSPVYNQSYYEIFSLGNTSKIFNFNSLHNKFAIRNYLFLDFPAGGMTIRTGYLGSYYSTSVHNLDRHIISHNIMLGFVKEFVAFGGREMRRRNLFQSAYY